MLDPSLIDLLSHLNWSPPAVVRPAPLSAANAQKAAYAEYVTFLEEQLATWIEHGQQLRAELWQMLADDRAALEAARLSDLVAQFEDGLRYGARVLARKEKHARRDEGELSGSSKTFVAGQHSRLLKVARDFHAEGKDFASFLRALRAELDADSRGGPPFEDADALQEYLLKSMA